MDVCAVAQNMAAEDERIKNSMLHFGRIDRLCIIRSPNDGHKLWQGTAEVQLKYGANWRSSEHQMHGSHAQEGSQLVIARSV